MRKGFWKGGSLDQERKKTNARSSTNISALRLMQMSSFTRPALDKLFHEQ